MPIRLIPFKSHRIHIKHDVKRHVHHRLHNHSRRHHYTTRHQVHHHKFNEFLTSNHVSGHGAESHYRRETKNEYENDIKRLKKEYEFPKEHVHGGKISHPHKMGRGLERDIQPIAKTLKFKF